MRMRGIAVGPSQAGWCPADSLPSTTFSRASSPQQSNSSIEHDEIQRELLRLRQEVVRLRKENKELRQSVARAH